MPKRDKNLKVLLVEDNLLLRTFMAELLADAGFEVVEAACSHDALAQLERNKGVSVLFTDVDMPPGASGVELAEEVHQRWPHIGLVVTSGHSQMSDADLPDHGRFIPKPARPELVLSAIEQASRHETGR